jgi:trk system potassium uptake protein TrkA
MKIIIMGCGRVGSQVSQLLVKHGHQVTVIDHDANALARLGMDFKGKVVRGLGFDKNVLLEAGIETAEGFVAASSSDNANIVAARIARTIFRVPRVVARLYDPVRAEVYQRLGPYRARPGGQKESSKLSLMQIWIRFRFSEMAGRPWSASKFPRG